MTKAVLNNPYLVIVAALAIAFTATGVYAQQKTAEADLPESPAKAPIKPEAAMATSATMVDDSVAAAVPVIFLNNSAPATSTEAPPPNPLNSATSCGMAVISIVRAR